MTYKEGDCVIVQTKHYGPYYGIVGAVDPDGSIVVRHDVKRYKEHPTGATYVNAKHLELDVPPYPHRFVQSNQLHSIIVSHPPPRI